MHPHGLRLAVPIHGRGASAITATSAPIYLPDQDYDIPGADEEQNFDVPGENQDFVEPSVLSATLERGVQAAALVQTATLEPAIQIAARQSTVPFAALEPIIQIAALEPAVLSAALQCAVQAAALEPAARFTALKRAILAAAHKRAVTLADLKRAGQATRRHGGGKKDKGKRDKGKGGGEEATAEVEAKAHRSHHCSYLKVHPGSEIMVSWSNVFTPA